MRSIKHLLKSCLLCFVLLTGFQAQAQNNDQKMINRAQAVQKAQQQVSGRVLRVDQSSTKFRIKVLQKSGRVVTVDVDKRSGRVTKQRSKK